MPVRDDTVLTLLRDLKSDVKDVNSTLQNNNRELGGVQTELKNLRSTNNEQKKEIAGVSKAVSNMETNYKACTARTAHPETQKRIRHLEGINSQAPRPAWGRTTSQEAAITIPFKSTIIKALPWLIMAVVVGAALGGFALTKWAGL